MTEAQLLARVMNRFGRRDVEFQNIVKAEIVAACEEVLGYGLWRFRVIEGTPFSFTANEYKKDLPAEVHQVTSLAKEDVPELRLVSDRKWQDEHKAGDFQSSTPKLRFARLMKKKDGGANVTQIHFGPKAAGGETVLWDYVEAPKASGLQDLPVFLHIGVQLCVIKSLTAEVVAAGETNLLVTNSYRNNRLEYEEKMTELWADYNAQPIDEPETLFDEGITVFRRHQRRRKGINAD